MNIEELIPQREPFLFIESFKITDPNNIETNYKFNEDEYFFKGHFPGNPIVPGVILCEHCFQSGAALISHGENKNFSNSLAVVSRVQNAKFKQIITPNQTITTSTTLIERMDNAAFFKSVIKNSEGKKALIIEFACTLVEGK